MQTAQAACGECNWKYLPLTENFSYRNRNVEIIITNKKTKILREKKSNTFIWDAFLFAHALVHTCQRLGYFFLSWVHVPVWKTSTRQLRYFVDALLFFACELRKICWNQFTKWNVQKKRTIINRSNDLKGIFFVPKIDYSLLVICDGKT